MTESPTSDALARLSSLVRSVPRPLTPPRPSLAEELRDLADVADALPDDVASWDLYGDDGTVTEVERRTAELLGKKAAAFFPSGVMAQQAALRTWCDRSGSRRVALPDLSHLLKHEEDGPRRLHGFDIEHLTWGSVTPTRADVDAVPGRLGAVLVELPLRDGGYLLPSWEDLTDVAAACRERGVPLHIDGARLWESAPYYGRGLAEIAAVADSVYVSFYKGLAGLAGAALAGSADMIAEAKVWRRRHGGTLYTIAPFALAALRGLDRRLPHMARCHEFAVGLADEVRSRGFRTVPEQVQTTAFRLYAERDPETLLHRAVELAETEGLGLPGRWTPGRVPGWSFTEITVTPPMIESWEAPHAAADALERLLA